MLVIAPYVEMHPRTRDALEAWPGEVEYRYVGDSEAAYAEFFCEVWARGIDFCVCEQDMAPHPWAFAELSVCDKPYCAFPYPWTTSIGAALGLTAFSGLFTRHLSDAATEAASIDGGYGAGSWRQFDYWLMRTVLEEKHGWTPHLHLPPCEHENEAKRLVEPFRSYSLATHLRMVGYELAQDGRSAKWVGRFRQAVIPPTTPR